MRFIEKEIEVFKCIAGSEGAICPEIFAVHPA
jgi:hypothetical protein